MDTFIHAASECFSGMFPQVSKFIMQRCMTGSKHHSSQPVGTSTRGQLLQWKCRDCLHSVSTSFNTLSECSSFLWCLIKSPEASKFLNVEKPAYYSPIFSLLLCQQGEDGRMPPVRVACQLWGPFCLAEGSLDKGPISVSVWCWW